MQMSLTFQKELIPSCVCVCCLAISIFSDLCILHFFLCFPSQQFHVFSVGEYEANGVSFCRVCDLLQSGAVMNKSYQPHEGHIPYLLQLFIDYNLYGMNLLNLAAVKFRRGRKMGMKL